MDADAERLRQVLDNLIGNALQHTPRGSAVTVTVTSARRAGQLTVADRGPGLTADQASRVFERFYRTDRARTRARGGTGLGLSIAAALAAAHAGTITVDTQPGRGAAFQVRLPLSTRSARRPAPVNRTRLPWAAASVRPETSQPAATRSQARPIDYRATGQPAARRAPRRSCRSPRRRHGDQPYRYLARRRAWLPVLGPLLLAGALAARLQREHATPAPASSSSSGSGSQASFRQCLQRQGVSLPQSGPRRAAASRIPGRRDRPGMRSARP